MALTKIYTKTIYGKEINFNNAYIEITRVEGTKNELTIEVNIYSNLTKENSIDSKIYKFTPSISDNSFRWDKQGYEYLKTLDEYKDIVDLLDEGQTV